MAADIQLLLEEQMEIKENSNDVFEWKLKNKISPTNTGPLNVNKKVARDCHDTKKVDEVKHYIC